MQIALETKPEKPAMGPEGVEPKWRSHHRRVAVPLCSLGGCDFRFQVWAGDVAQRQSVCLAHTRAPSTGGGSDRWDNDLDPGGPAAQSPALPARPRPDPAVPYRPRPVPPAQPQSPDLPGWAVRTAT